MFVFPEELLPHSRGEKALGIKIKQKPTPNMSALSAADKKPKAGRKRPRPRDFDYILEDNEQTIEKKSIKTNQLR